jgi:hypothetical protein
MPADDGLRLDHDESVPPTAPRAPESKPEDALFPLQRGRPTVSWSKVSC